VARPCASTACSLLHRSPTGGNAAGPSPLRPPQGDGAPVDYFDTLPDMQWTGQATPGSWLLTDRRRGVHVGGHRVTEGPLPPRCPWRQPTLAIPDSWRTAWGYDCDLLRSASHHKASRRGREGAREEVLPALGARHAASLPWQRASPAPTPLIATCCPAREQPQSQSTTDELFRTSKPV
jgi:hypothetical protein